MDSKEITFSCAFERIQNASEQPFRLAGSIQVKAGVDVDKAIKRGRKTLGKLLKKAMAR
jgi:hypothetical protein